MQPQRKKNVKKTLKEMYRCKALYAMILPAIITTFIFHYIPIYGLQIAFKDYSTGAGIWGSEWVGLEHFKRFVSYPYFWKMLRNTIWISVCSLLINMPCPIIFAIMLNELKSEKIKKVSNMITYAPHFMSTIVVCSMTSLFLKKDGLINILLGFLGIEAVDFLTIPGAFAFIYALSGLWQGLGWGTIIYMATLSGVSQELVEAARIDGASRMQVIRHVQIPHLKPTVVTLFIMNLGRVLSVGFEKVFLLQNPLNKPASSVISTYTYEIGLVGGDFSYSSAIGLFNNVVGFLMVVLANQISKKVAKVSLW